jgi:endonuclease/exonuclease/phosphatase family metal-dependent hydrolase
LADRPTYPAHDPRTQLDHALADGLERVHRVEARTVRGEVSDHLALVVDLAR